MNTHLTTLPLIDSDSTVQSGSCRDPLNSDSSHPTLFHWCYRFQDGSSVKGTIGSYPEQLSAKYLNNQIIEADYLSNDGKTVLLHWEDKDFVCFDLTEQGELLIIASNDNFVGNSMCLVYSSIRSRAQVTEQENQWVGEAFNGDAWSFSAEKVGLTAQKTDLSLDFALSPLFPFFSVNLNVKKKQSQKTYRWTYYPYYSLFPWFQVV